LCQIADGIDGFVRFTHELIENQVDVYVNVIMHVEGRSGLGCGHNQGYFALKLSTRLVFYAQK
jgi:hypothetical protein